MDYQKVVGTEFSMPTTLFYTHIQIMKITRLAIGFFLLSLPVSSSAQYKGTTPEQRLGDKVIGNQKALNIYNDYVRSYQAKDWQAAYRPWRELLTNIPYCNFGLTYYGTANEFLRPLIIEERDSIQKLVFFQDLEEMLDYAENNLEAINSFDDQKHPIVSRGDIQCWRAHLAWSLRDQLPQGAMPVRKNYEMYVAAFKTVRESNLNADGEVAPFFLEEYFKVCTRLYEEDKEKHLEQLLTDYVDCLESCDKMMEVYKADSTRWVHYAGARNNIQFYFNETGAGTVDNLVKYYTPVVEANKKNPEVLNRAIHLMMLNGCFGQDVFYTACEYSNIIQANYANCIGLGQMSLTVDKNREVARDYFLEAIRLAKNANERSLAARFAADAMAQTPFPVQEKNESVKDFNARVQQWRNGFSAPIQYYSEALQNAQEAGLKGQYLAEMYYKQADCYRKQQNFSEAKRSLNNVLIAYSAFNAERHKNLKQAIASDSERYAKQQASYTAQLKSKTQREAWERQNAEKFAQQQAERAFWKKK